MPQHWTQTYFGQLYGDIYRRHLISNERNRREWLFLRDHLRVRSMEVLDIAAGFGRHSRLLARENHVAALDLNLDYLYAARKRLGEARMRMLHLVRGDMRSLPFRDESFGAALLLFNSFGYFAAAHAPAAEREASGPLWKLPQIFYERGLVSEQFGSSPEAQHEIGAGGTGEQDAAVLREANRVLRVGGSFIIEVANPEVLISAVTEAPRRHLSGGSYDVNEEYSYDPETRVLTNKTSFRMGRRREDGGFALRLYTRGEMQQLLERAGFDGVQLYGAYEDVPYEPEESEIMLFHARKP